MNIPVAAAFAVVAAFVAVAAVVVAAAASFASFVAAAFAAPALESCWEVIDHAPEVVVVGNLAVAAVVRNKNFK